MPFIVTQPKSRTIIILNKALLDTSKHTRNMDLSNFKSINDKDKKRFYKKQEMDKTKI